jgi:hypothetical protein
VSGRSRSVPALSGRVQVDDRGEFSHLACQRVEQADSHRGLAEKEEEALSGSRREQVVVVELWNGHMDELAGGGVEELVELLLLSPASMMGSPPREAHGSEADV